MAHPSLRRAPQPVLMFHPAIIVRTFPMPVKGGPRLKLDGMLPSIREDDDQLREIGLRACNPKRGRIKCRIPNIRESDGSPHALL